jgi:hypothetical protein
MQEIFGIPESKFVERVELDSRVSSYSALVQQDEDFPIVLQAWYEDQADVRLSARQALKLLEVLERYRARLEAQL